MNRLLLAAISTVVLCQCKSSPALHTNLSTDPKIIAKQSADADARWALREQAREPMDAGAHQVTAATQPYYDKGFAAGVRDKRAGRPRDPFREDEGGSDTTMLAIFGQGYDAGYDSK